MAKDTKFYDILGVSILLYSLQDRKLTVIKGLSKRYRGRVEEGVQDRGFKASPW
tara:strand:- start:144 stop:305 length:162 start_codon:yes stop_codon:yes gene_type:complete